ncbi:MAG: hypothetical protein O9341_19295 [Paucibacter sp.]|nr:hypothetical protein [Roseateles sp.]
MERLLVLRLEALGCSAEAWFNGVPLGRVDGQRSTVLNLPVHEYALAGSNVLELLINPGPVLAMDAGTEAEPALSDGQLGARLCLLLPRMGALAHPSHARTLAALDWAPAEAEVYRSPTRLQQRFELPISFPRWRWLDAPVQAISPALKASLVDHLMAWALGLAQGDAEPLIRASRLRLEELAQAYQRDLSAEVARLRAHVQSHHAAQALKPVLPSLGSLQLRPVAGGRLLECLAADGLPFLRSPGRTASGAACMLHWPLRVSAIEGEFYVLR